MHLLSIATRCVRGVKSVTCKVQVVIKLVTISSGERAIVRICQGSVCTRCQIQGLAASVLGMAADSTIGA